MKRGALDQRVDTATSPPVRRDYFQAVGLGLLSGAFLASAFPPFQFDNSLAVGLLPLLWVCANRSSGPAAVCGMLAALVGFLPSQLWMFHTVPEIGLAVVVTSTLSTGLACALLGSLVDPNRMTRLLWLAPCILVSIELARRQIMPPFFSFHSLGMGSVTLERTIFTGAVLPTLGLHGVSAVAIFSAAVGVVVMAKTRSRDVRFGAAFIPLGISALFTLPLISVPLGDNEVDVLGVQSTSRSYPVLATLSSFAGGLDRPTDIVLWPERAIDVAARESGPFRAAELAVFEEMAHPVVVGFEADGPSGERENSVALWVPDVGQVHRSSQRRPEWFSGFAPGDVVATFDLGDDRLGVIVGSDIDHSFVARSLALDGADALLVIGDDEGWGAIGAALHNLVVKVRSNEVGRDVLRVTREGPSVIARPGGAMAVILDHGQEGFVATNLTMRQGLTPFVRFGWWIAYLVALFTALFLCVELVRRSRSPGALRSAQPLESPVPVEVSEEDSIS